MGSTRQAIMRRSLATKESSSDGLVPSRRQYLRLKAHYPHAILLYRLGDFYEAFDEDARIVARDARITLTSRSFGRNGRVPMAGIPHHALNHYLARLLAAGHTIAIAEQVSEPGKGLIERAVTRVLTPGTVAEAALLPTTENRYLAAVARLPERTGLAWVDVSTGEFAVLELSGAERDLLLAEEYARLAPAETLVPDTDEIPLPPGGCLTRLEHWHFEPERAAQRLRALFATRSLAPFGCEHLPAALAAAGAIVVYLERTNPALLSPDQSPDRSASASCRAGCCHAAQSGTHAQPGYRWNARQPARRARPHGDADGCPHPSPPGQRAPAGPGRAPPSPAHRRRALGNPRTPLPLGVDPPGRW